MTGNGNGNNGPWYGQVATLGQLMIASMVFVAAIVGYFIADERRKSEIEHRVALAAERYDVMKQRDESQDRQIAKIEGELKAYREITQEAISALSRQLAAHDAETRSRLRDKRDEVR
jgi:hypothetical protein